MVSITGGTAWLLDGYLGHRSQNGKERSEKCCWGIVQDVHTSSLAYLSESCRVLITDGQSAIQPQGSTSKQYYWSGA